MFCEAERKDTCRQVMISRSRMRLLNEGSSNRQIAAALGVTVATAKAHLTKIFRKLEQPTGSTWRWPRTARINDGSPHIRESPHSPTTKV